MVGFAAGQGIPEVKVNRLLLNNVDVRGVGWGAYAMVRPATWASSGEALLPLMESGASTRRSGRRTTSTEFGQALVDMEERRTLGKSVIRLR